MPKDGSSLPELMIFFVWCVAYSSDGKQKYVQELFLYSSMTSHDRSYSLFFINNYNFTEYLHVRNVQISKKNYFHNYYFNS
jgi:hypothetical protein